MQHLIDIDYAIIVYDYCMLSFTMNSISEDRVQIIHIQ